MADCLECARNRGFRRFLHLSKLVGTTGLVWLDQPFRNTCPPCRLGPNADILTVAQSVVALRHDCFAGAERGFLLRVWPLSFSSGTPAGAIGRRRLDGSRKALQRKMLAAFNERVCRYSGCRCDCQLAAARLVRAGSG